MPSMLRSTAYDTVCHEHLEYYSLATVRRILGNDGLTLAGICTHFANIEDTTDHTFAESQIAAYDRAPRPESVPDRLVSALGGIGDFRAVSAFVTAYREAGVTLPAVRPIGFPDATHYEPTVEAGATA